MKLAEAFARKTYPKRKTTDTIWQRNVPISHGELINLSYSLGAYGVTISPNELTKKYRKEVEQYFEWRADGFHDYVADHHETLYLDMERALIQEIFGNIER